MSGLLLSRTSANPRALPLTLRLAGIWLMWSAWCSAAGWLLSAMHLLDGRGTLALLPALIAGGWYWLKLTAPGAPASGNPVRKFFRRLRRPAPLAYVVMVLLSLLAGSLYFPWSFDAASYRLPRVLYWWSAHHWYWTGSLDTRLDYSSIGLEWQMLPVMELTHSDRFLFLLNWVPFLLMPGLVFVAFRALGVNPRSARRWMWLLPSGCCFALQSSGLANDGYMVNYLLAAIACLNVAFRSRRTGGIWMALLAVGLLTSAKISNLPLLLPVGVLMLMGMRRVSWWGWRFVPFGLLVVVCSFIPLAILAWLNTGDWTGNPADQFRVKNHGALGGATANLVLFALDVTQPPLLPGSQRLNAMLNGINKSAFVAWLQRSHGSFQSIRYLAMVNEGSGLGFCLALYVACLLGGLWFVRDHSLLAAHAANSLPWAWRVAPWLAWVAFGVFLAKLGAQPRIAAPYFPLLLVTVLRSPRVAALESKPLFAWLAILASATTITAIILTPARPLVPIQTLARISQRPWLESSAAKYRLWDNLRDDLAPIRAQLPPAATRLGYAAGWLDTPYGLFKPLGCRTIVELGLPLGSRSLPPPDLEYAVVTERGVRERYQVDLPTWLNRVRGEIIFSFPRNAVLDAHSGARYESWYLVKLSDGKKG